MPSIRVDDCHGLWRDPSVSYPRQKCAPEVYLDIPGDMRVRLPSCFLLYQIFARVAERRLHLTVNQASYLDFGGSSPSPCIMFSSGERVVKVAWLIPNQLVWVQILPLLPNFWRVNPNW